MTFDEALALWSPFGIAARSMKEADPHHYVTTCMAHAAQDLAAAGADENEIRAHKALIGAAVNERFQALCEHGAVGHA